MNNLPPLRTVVREATPPPGGAPGSGPVPPPPPPIAGLDHPRLPLAAKPFLTELVANGLLSADAVTPFLVQLGDRIPHLTDRDRVADALVSVGRLTRFQATRALAKTYHGMRFGPYRVKNRLGSGSVGVVFRAEHEFLGRDVAVKVMPADNHVPADVRARFAAEARVLAGLDHPHVVRALDAGILPAPGPGQQALYFLVLELVSGGDVEEFVYANGIQPIGVAAEWGRQAAAGLRAVHDAGLVHRDLKPSNLVLTDARRVKLLDFGLVHEAASTRTMTGAVLGSLDFLAPEQLAGASTVGPPADVYSLGVTLFWVLTGQLPLPPASTPGVAADNLRSGVPKRATELRAEIPAEFDDLIRRMLSRNPADRPTAAQVVDALAPLAAPSADTPDAGGATDADRMRTSVAELEASVRSKAADAEAARAAVLTALAAVAATRPGEPPGHLRRVRGYVRMLAGKLAGKPDWPMIADPRFVEVLSRAAAIHDVGLVGVPDAAFPTDAAAPPDPAYLRHPDFGCEILEALALGHGPALPFLRVARDIVRHHHERWDGTGYPDRLAAERIPHAARVVAVADAYDTARRGEPGRPSVSHAAAAAELRRGSGKAFDPKVVEAFAACEADFEQLFAAIPDVEGQPWPPADPTAPAAPAGGKR
ncbi:MAG: protein kinase domain-containing protein [Fimbriiglobus sp.]